MSLKDFPLDNFRARKSNFIPQHRSDQCVPAAILNVFKDLSDRKNLKLHLSLSKVSSKCQYQDGMGCPAQLDLGKLFHDILIPHGLYFHQSYGRDSDLDILRAVTADEEKSLPIVALHPDYFPEIGVECRSQNEDYKMDHVVVVFAIDTVEIFFWDPFEGFLKKGQDFEGYTETINIPRFLNLWSKARTSKWMAWIEPISSARIDKDWDNEKSGR